MSESITIQDYSTEFTDVINKVQLEKSESGKSYLYQERFLIHQIGKKLEIF